MLRVRIGPRRLGHVNLFVSDLEGSVKFYREVCGFVEVFREPGISMAFLSNGNTHHDVALMETATAPRAGRDGHVQVRTGRGRTAGLNHLGFEMETELGLVEAIRRAKAAGVRIERTTDHQISHSLYLYDPDGHMLEFYADVVSDWRQLYQELEGQLISGAWDPEAAPPLAESLIDTMPRIEVPDDALLPARATTCAGLPVRDLAVSVAFYTDVLGLTVNTAVGGADYAVLSGAPEGGCDVCLVQTRDVPKTKLVFAGVQMQAGKPISEAFEMLRDQGLTARIVGDDAGGAVVVVDPDGITLVYSVSPFETVMASWAGALFDAIREVNH